MTTESFGEGRSRARTTHDVSPHLYGDLMAASIEALVNPDMLVWARETARLSTAQAAERLKVDEAQLHSWETGDQRPSIAKLEKIAKSYRRPLAAFFLAERPDVPARVTDFRRSPDAEPAWGPYLASEIRRADEQRENLLDLFELRDEPPPSDWAVGANGTLSTESLAVKARDHLMAHARRPLPTWSSSANEWFAFWSSALEDMGVLVIAMSRVDSKEARGFSVAETHLPVVAVNGAEHWNGRIFTLMHEYAHLLLGSSALCDLHEAKAPQGKADELEIACNRMASRILVPWDEFLARPIASESDRPLSDWPIEVLRNEAREWGVSPEVVLRRLVDVGRASVTFYDQWRQDLPDRTQMANIDERQGPPGGDGLRTKVRDLGKGYVREVASAHREGLLSTYEASNLLNAKTTAIAKMLEYAGGDVA